MISDDKNVDDEWGNQELPGLTDKELFEKDWNKAAGRAAALANPTARKKWYDNPEWLALCAEKRRQALKTSEVRKKISKGLERRYQDPNERLKTSEATKRSFEKDPTRKERQIKTSKKTWSDTKLKKQASLSHKKQWADPAKRENLSSTMKKIRQYPIMTPNGLFESTTLAAEAFGISKDMVGYYRKTRPTEWYYAGKKPHSNKKSK